MTRFCNKCGSLMASESCSNRNCENHIQGVEFATYSQIEYIMDLSEKLRKDQSQMDYSGMSKKQASKLIDELREELEVGE